MPRSRACARWRSIRLISEEEEEEEEGLLTKEEEEEEGGGRFIQS
jgi:hypothetical protein